MEKEKLLANVTEMDDRINSIYASISDNRKHIEELIYEMVESEGGSMNIRDTKSDDYCYVCYDGGNHPEYNSTMSASVETVKCYVDSRGQKTFDVSLDDIDGLPLADEYEAYRMNFDDLANVFDFVKWKCYGTV